MNITKLSDLKTGHIIETKNGKFYMAFKGKSVFSSKDIFIGLSNDAGHLHFSSYNDVFNAKNNREYDIIKIYSPNFHEFYSYKEELQHLVNIINKKDNIRSEICQKADLVYNRETPKKLTMSEVSELLGYKVEIVKENRREE